MRAALAAVDIQLETEEQGGNEKKNEAVPSCQRGSQAQLFENPSSREKSESDNGLRRSGRVRRATRAIQPELSQIDRLSRASYLLLAQRVRLEP
jgi:hypothetical protein